MRVLIAAIGSDGDVQPFLALAQELLAAGHDVCLTTSDNYEARARSFGISFAPIGPAWDEGEARKTFARVLAEKHPLKQLGIVVESIEAPQRDALPELLRLVRDFDVVVYPPIFVAAVAAARVAGIRHVSLHFAPLHRAQDYGPTGLKLGRVINSLSWKAASLFLRSAIDARLNTIVTAAGLPPWRDVLLRASHSQLLDLVAVSPHELPRDPLWPSQTQVTGYLFVNEPAFADSQLEAFIAREPPIVIGFGSMTGMDANAVTAIVHEATRDLGRRIVLQAGWAGLGGGHLHDHVFRAGFVPHAWLFSRAACVVHHGGAGTTAAAFRAGIPQAIVWHLGDQPVWGRVVHDHGVGPRPRSHRKLTAKWLRRTIEDMVTNEAMRERARVLGELIQRENGAANAVRAIERAISL